MREGGAEICSECCASIRDADCAGCQHYAAVRQYESSRHVSSELRDGHFIAEFNPEVLDAVNEALELAQRGGTREALAILTGLLRDYPLQHHIYFGIGTICAFQEKHEEAIKWFDQAIRIFPYNVESHYNKAVAYVKLRDLANAVRSYRKVVEVGDPGEPEVMHAQSIIDDMAEGILESEGIGLDAYLQASDEFNQAFARMERGDWEGALAGFRAVVAINERNVPSHGNMGMCHAHLGQRAMALAELDRALELDPDYEPARDNRKLVEKMTEGRPLERVIHHSINFGRDAAARSHRNPPR